MKPTNRSKHIFANRVLDGMNRSILPSIQLHLEVSDPDYRAGGSKRDWSLYLAGAEAGADAAYELLCMPFESINLLLCNTLGRINEIVDRSDDLSVPAVEELLTLRKELQDHADNAWRNLRAYLKIWFSGVVGLNVQRIDTADKAQVGPLLATFLSMLHSGLMHPFFAWANATYANRQDLRVGGLRKALCEYQEKGIEPSKVLEFLDSVGYEVAVYQYLRWVSVEYKEVVRRLDVKALGLAMPTAQLTEWISSELFDEQVDEV